MRISALATLSSNILLSLALLPRRRTQIGLLGHLPVRKSSVSNRARLCHQTGQVLLAKGILFVLTLRLCPTLIYITSSTDHRQFRCSFCAKSFDTTKKRRYVSTSFESQTVHDVDLSSNHTSTVHKKRFHCRVLACSFTKESGGRPFGLKEDLLRHQRSAHPEIFPQQTLSRQTCPVSGCLKKLTHRKDNARRHLIHVHKMSSSTAHGLLEDTKVT